MISSLDNTVKAKIASHLLAKADCFYAQEEQLKQKLSTEGWGRHLTNQLEQAIKFGDAYEQEKKQYGFELYKQHLGHGTYDSDLLSQYSALRESGEYYMDQKYAALRSNQEKSAEYEQQINELRSQMLAKEVKLFGQEAEHLIFDHQSQQGQVEAYMIETIERLLPSFKYDKSLSATNYFSLSCMLHDPWKIRIFIDRRSIFLYGKLARLDMSLLICNKKNKGFNVYDKYMFYPSVFIENFMVRSGVELLVALKYKCRIYQLHMEMFNAPIQQAFEELEQEGFAN